MKCLTGDKMITKGKKELTRFRLRGNKYQDALKYFNLAVNMFKCRKEWEKCIYCLVMCSQCDNRNKLHYYQEIVKCCKQYDGDKYLEWLNKLIYEAAQEGNFKIMAETYLNLAEYYDQNKDIQNSLQSYHEVLNLQKIDNCTDGIYQINHKIAELYVQLEEYDKALIYFKNVLDYYKDGKTSRWHANYVVLSIILLYIIKSDLEITNKMIIHYSIHYPKFINTAEHAFVEKIINSIKECDNVSFTRHKCEYHLLKKLLPFQMKMLDTISALMNKSK